MAWSLTVLIPSHPPLGACPSSRHESVKHGATSVPSMLNQGTETQGWLTFICWIVSWSSEAAAARAGQVLSPKWGSLCKDGEGAISWGHKLPHPVNHECLYLWLGRQMCLLGEPWVTKFLQLLHERSGRLGPTLAIKSNSDSNAVRESGSICSEESRCYFHWQKWGDAQIAQQCTDSWGTI